MNWISYRDSHCDFEVAQYEGGSIQPLMRYTCLESGTRQRIDELKVSIKDRTER